MRAAIAVLMLLVLGCGGGEALSGDSCKTASDCRGVLAQYCMECAGGGSDCLHFACVDGVCQTQICGR